MDLIFFTVSTVIRTYFIALYICIYNIEELGAALGLLAVLSTESLQAVAGLGTGDQAELTLPFSRAQPLAFLCSAP